MDGSIQITNLSESVFPLLLNQVPFPQKAKPAMLDIISGEDKVIPVIKDNPRGIWLGFPGLCKGCGLCIHKCPTKVIHWSNELGVYGTPRVQPKMEGCILCGMCQMVCPDCAIRVEKKPV